MASFQQFGAQLAGRTLQAALFERFSVRVDRRETRLAVAASRHDARVRVRGARFTRDI
jgi:hypothetical protein